MSAAAHAEGWSAAFRLARRESREGLKGFRVFAFALFLGVAALAAIGSLSAAFQQGLQDEKRQLLGGDAEIASIEGALPADVQSFLAARGRVSHIVGAQLMARASQGNARTVVQLKAVDGAYPLIGAVALTGGVGALSDALAPKPSADGEIWGAVADQTLLDKLGIQIGGRVIIGQATFEIRAALSDEPDRASAGFMLGPRLIASEDAARATGLLDTSALVNNAYRIVLSNRSPSDFAAAFNEAYPNKGWRVRTAAEAARGLERLMRNLNVFLTMVGLSALVIGGVGASNAVGAYLRRKTPVIATLKCLGATGGLILKTYLAQILAVALMSVALGLVTGALAPFAAKATFGSLLPFDAALGLYPAALGEAAGFGVLAALAFAFWPLGEASRAPAATLFRSIVETKNSRAPLRDYIIAAGLAAVFVGLAIFLSEDRKFAIVLAASSIFAYFVLRLIAWGAVSLARRFWRPRRAAFRIAAAYLTRPGAATASVSVSLGLGLTLLAIVSLIDVNLTRDIRKALPQRAPALFFADIPYGDAAKFDARMKALANGAEFERYYMMRAGVLALNGRPLDEIPGAKRSPWARDQDWGVTIEKTFPRALGAITEGKSWQADYDGPPLMALSDWQAKIFKLSVGNSMTLSIEGRAVTAKIAALYKENWDREGLNFTAVFAPGTLEAANPSSVASLRTPDLASESIIARSVAEEFPNVTVIRTREVAQSIADILSNIGLAIRVLTGVTILAGVVVLFGAIASDFAGKLRDAMIMRTIGASRRRILAAHAVEYAALGAAPALAALALGAFGSWYVVAKRMDIEWTPSPSLLLAIVLGAVVTTLAMGLAAAATALGGRPWPVLRSE